MDWITCLSASQYEESALNPLNYAGALAKHLVKNGKCCPLMKFAQGLPRVTIDPDPFSIFADGSLYLSSPVDPLFIALPLLEQARMQV